jgi:hypothetical protein
MALKNEDFIKLWIHDIEGHACTYDLPLEWNLMLFNDSLRVDQLLLSRRTVLQEKIHLISILRSRTVKIKNDI